MSAAYNLCNGKLCGGLEFFDRSDYMENFPVAFFGLTTIMAPSNYPSNGALYADDGLVSEVISPRSSRYIQGL